MIKRNSIRLLIVAILGIAVLSCSVEKKVTYFQNLTDGQLIQKNEMVPAIKIQAGDKLYIRVSSKDDALVKLFNLSENNTSSNKVTIGYTVNDKGKIDFPVLGSIEASGKTREELTDYIKNQLVSKSLVKDAVVTIEFLNIGVSVLGEVKTPGRYQIERDRITILEALGMAGDLTIQGKRENVKVLREECDGQRVYTIDLTSAESVYKSPVYYLQPNDVVYVEPNEMKARQSTINGNSVRNVSFWMSLASLLTTIAVLIFK